MQLRPQGYKLTTFNQPNQQFESQTFCLRVGRNQKMKLREESDSNSPLDQKVDTNMKLMLLNMQLSNCLPTGLPFQVKVTVDNIPLLTQCGQNAVLQARAGFRVLILSTYYVDQSVAESVVSPKLQYQKEIIPKRRCHHSAVFSNGDCSLLS